ncbi:holin [Vibrio phage D81]
MILDPLSAALELGTSVINKIWPDPVKQAEEQRKLQELYQKGDLAQLNAEVQLMLGQLNVNKVEAANKSIFIAGWRPFIGWVGGVAMAYQFIIYPILIWVWAIAQARGYVSIDLSAPPIIETGALFSIVTAMLGIGAMRSHDKKQRTQTDSLKK